jgi:pimeloyl-ACP methyl ester carboxylesterase
MPRSALMKLLTAHTNGIELAYYTCGAGETLVLLLHGFPDDAATMLALMEGLDQARYTLVAPFMRGHTPSEGAQPITLLEELARDMIGLIDALGHDRAVLIGHDWGAITAWITAQLAPERVIAVAGLSVPPPRAFLRTLASGPAQWLRSAYILAFQLPLLPELVLGWDDGALIGPMWRSASPRWTPDPTRLAKVRATLRGRSARAALGYYRGLILGAITQPAAWRAGITTALRPIQPPALMIFGMEDGALGPELFSPAALEGCFASTYELHGIPECGHFPQHEAPALTLDLLAGWLDRHTPSCASATDTIALDK